MIHQGVQLRADNGGEYTGSGLQEPPRQAGIKHCTTTAYKKNTGVQGIVESANHIAQKALYREHICYCLLSGEK